MISLLTEYTYIAVMTRYITINTKSYTISVVASLSKSNNNLVSNLAEEYTIDKIKQFDLTVSKCPKRIS